VVDSFLSGGFINMAFKTHFIKYLDNSLSSRYRNRCPDATPSYIKRAILAIHDVLPDVAVLLVTRDEFQSNVPKKSTTRITN
jgi:hypothetical protein